MATIEGVPGNPPKSGDRQVTCDAVGKRVSMIMYTRGQLLLHEYTHAYDIMRPVFGEGQKSAGDKGYGFAKCRALDKGLAAKNADSYASFASELLWPTKCDRDFDPPVPLEQYTRRQILEETMIRIGVTPTSEQLDAAAGERVDAVISILKCGY